jgi:predicted aminopeptidase
MMRVRSSILAVLACSLMLQGCYMIKQGAATLEYHADAPPIEKVLIDPGLPEDERGMLTLVLDIRSYAESSLGLRENRNFTRYKRVDRSYLVDVVSASRSTSFEPYLWRFPFFGESPYKGFFRREDALRQADRLKKRDYDVIVRRVRTFSTLGFLIDPVYSFMKEYSVPDLAELIIHEQAHATLFLKDQVQFDEEFATFVGREGTRAYIESRYGADSAIYRRFLLELRDEEVYLGLMRTLHDELARLYERDMERDSLLKEKERIIEEFKEDFISAYEERFSTDSYRGVGSLHINNALILSVMRYTHDLELFHALYRSMGGDLPGMIEKLRILEKIKTDPKTYMRNLIEKNIAGS